VRRPTTLCNSSKFMPVFFRRHQAHPRDVGGRAGLGTSPLHTGSPAAAMTIGILVVACLAASGARVPIATMTYPKPA
jgi:hypothetical protein